MYRKCFFKNKGVLSRRFVASGLAAVFSAGMFGSYAGAMEQQKQDLFPVNKAPKLANFLNNDFIKEDNDAKEVFKFFINFPKLTEQELMYNVWQCCPKSEVEDNKILSDKDLSDKDFLIRVHAYSLLLKFYEFKDKNEFSSIDVFLGKLESNDLVNHFNCLNDDDRINLLEKIKKGWGKNLLEEVKKEKLNKDEQNDSENDNKEVYQSIEEKDRREILIKLLNESINEDEGSFINKYEEEVLENEKHKQDNSKKTENYSRIISERKSDDEKVNPSIGKELLEKDDKEVYPSIGKDLSEKVKNKELEDEQKIINEHVEKVLEELEKDEQDNSKKIENYSRIIFDMSDEESFISKYKEEVLENEKHKQDDLKNIGTIFIEGKLISFVLNDPSLAPDVKNLKDKKWILKNFFSKDLVDKHFFELQDFVPDYEEILRMYIADFYSVYIYKNFSLESLKQELKDIFSEHLQIWIKSLPKKLELLNLAIETIKEEEKEEWEKIEDSSVIERSKSSGNLIKNIDNKNKYSKKRKNEFKVGKRRSVTYGNRRKNIENFKEMRRYNLELIHAKKNFKEGEKEEGEKIEGSSDTEKSSDNSIKNINNKNEYSSNVLKSKMSDAGSFKGEGEKDEQDFKKDNEELSLSIEEKVLKKLKKENKQSNSEDISSQKNSKRELYKESIKELLEKNDKKLNLSTKKNDSENIISQNKSTNKLEKLKGDKQKNLEKISLHSEFIDKNENEQNDSKNTNLLDKIINENEISKKIKNEEYEQDNFKNDDKKENLSEKLEKEIKESGKEMGELLEEKKSIDKQKSDKNIKNKTKNKFKKTIVVVPVIILLALIVAKTLAVKGNSNTGVPNNNKDDEKVNPSIEPEKDKDDEKVKPPIDPREPSTDPESDDQNPEQNNREERPSVVPSNILKATGATVTAGTFAGSGAYLVNKVLKSGKPSEVKNLRNVDNKYMYLDSDGKEVIKTEEGKKDNYDADDENADNSGTKQLLEDKNAEKIEEEQEGILESSALSDDTEATSDEEKNKD